MNSGRPRSQSSSAQLAALLSMLCSVAVLEPTSRILAANPFFLYSHGISLNVAVGVLAGFLAIVGGALLLLFWSIKRWIAPPLASIAIALLAATLTFIFCYIIASKIDRFQSIPIVLCLSAVLAGFAAFSYIHLRQFSFYGLVLCVTFQSLPLILQAKVEGSEFFAEENVTWDDQEQRPNILLIVADELSGDLILDKDGNVRSQFPNLQKFQEYSTTYNNAYSTANQTDIAVPSILAGIYNLGSLSPSQRTAMQASLTQPTSGLPKWLGDNYDVSILSSTSSSQKSFRAAPMFLLDLFAIAGRNTLPPSFSKFFPDTTKRWIGFWGQATVLEYTRPSDVLETYRDMSEPKFLMWHTLFTHVPYSSDFTGAQFPSSYLGASQYPPGALGNRSLVALHRRMALAQVIEFDRRFGEVIDHLKEAGSWNNTVVVFTADHGRSYALHSDFREGDTAYERWGEVGRIPLIIKYRDFRRQKINTVSSNAQIASTILTIAGAKLKSSPEIAPVLGSHLPELPQPLGRDALNGGFTAWPKAEAAWWFERSTEYESPWTPEILNPRPSHEFETGSYANITSLPSDARRAVGELLALDKNDVDRGEMQTSRLSTFRYQVKSGPCLASYGDGIVTIGSTPVGTVAWQGNSLGWAILPRSNTSPYEFWCVQPNFANSITEMPPMKLWAPLGNTRKSGNDGERLTLTAPKLGEFGLASPMISLGLAETIYGSLTVTSRLPSQIWVRVAWFDKNGSLLYISAIERKQTVGSGLTDLSFWAAAPRDAKSFSVIIYAQPNINNEVELLEPLQLHSSVPLSSLFPLEESLDQHSWAPLAHTDLTIDDAGTRLKSGNSSEFGATTPKFSLGNIRTILGSLNVSSTASADVWVRIAWFDDESNLIALSPLERPLSVKGRGNEIGFSEDAPENAKYYTVQFYVDSRYQGEIVIEGPLHLYTPVKLTTPQIGERASHGTFWTPVGDTEIVTAEEAQIRLKSRQSSEFGAASKPFYVPHSRDIFCSVNVRSSVSTQIWLRFAYFRTDGSFIKLSAVRPMNAMEGTPTEMYFSDAAPREASKFTVQIYADPHSSGDVTLQESIKFYQLAE